MLLCMHDFNLENAGIYFVKAQLKSDPSPWLPYMEVCTRDPRDTTRIDADTTRAGADQ
jgi:hypothetical protein